MLEAKDQGHNAQVLSKKKRSSQNFFWRSREKNVFQKIIRSSTTFNNSKNSAVLKPMTGQFSRTGGLEAKDFKMCPRGLHLWHSYGLHLAERISILPFSSCQVVG